MSNDRTKFLIYGPKQNQHIKSQPRLRKCKNCTTPFKDGQEIVSKDGAKKRWYCIPCASKLHII